MTNLPTSVLLDQLGPELFDEYQRVRLSRMATAKPMWVCESTIAFTEASGNTAEREALLERIEAFYFEVGEKVETLAIETIQGISVDPYMSQHLKGAAHHLAQTVLQGRPLYAPYLSAEGTPLAECDHQIRLTALFSTSPPTKPMRVRERHCGAVLLYNISTHAWTRNAGPARRFELRRVLDNYRGVPLTYTV